MIKYIKIYGERNSGTTFCKELLQKNLNNIHIYEDKYNSKTGWKHGFPDIRKYKNHKNILFIFIIRDIRQWLNSMYHKPYHYKKIENVNSFLNNKLITSDKRKYHDVNINSKEKQNIIKLRYDKINAYKLFYSKVSNAIFVNLEDLQKDNQKFINTLNRTYKIKKEEKLKKIDYHTKTKKKEISKNYKMIIPSNIKNKNIKIENFIESLKKKYYLKKK